MIDQTTCTAPVTTNHTAACELEAVLGDLHEANSPFGLASLLALDEQDAYPEAACQVLDAWGLAQFYVPAALGGRLRTLPELLALLRLVARRDLTLAIAHAKTLLGAAPIWVGGSQAQQMHLANLIASGKQIALGLTEQAHGSDLIASDVVAIAADQAHFRLSGTKWCVNNATRGSAITIFARTQENGGPRGFSLLLVEKDQLAPESYQHLPRLKTHGIRGADISGIRFHESCTPSESLVGQPGAGLEITLKFLQLTRTMCAALSLGAGDTALRATLDFALTRQLYGKAVVTIPHARRVLIEAFCDLLISDCVATLATRALHIAPEQMSVWSAVVKYFVPTQIEQAIANLARVLGGRHYLREGHWNGVFQKIMRDHAIVGLFDGSTVVNLQVIVQQLRQLAERHDQPLHAATQHSRQQRLVQIATLDLPLPQLDLRRLALFNRGHDDLLEGLAPALERLRYAHPPTVEPAVLAQILVQAEALVAAASDHRARLLATLAQPDIFTNSPELFAFAKDFCRLHAAAACLHVWLHSMQAGDLFFKQGTWLVFCLARLLKPHGTIGPVLSQPWADQIARELVRRHEDNQLFGIVPQPLAGLAPVL